MKRIRNLFYLSLFLTVPGLQAVAQEKLHVSLPDSITTVGYATGLRKNLSGLVERITENQMNKDQITNPLDPRTGTGFDYSERFQRTCSIGCCPLAWYHFIDYWQ